MGSCWTSARLTRRFNFARPLPVNQARNLPLDLGDFLGPLASAALRWNVIEGRSAPAESKQVQE
jgi:hypothetical protein